MYTSTPNSLAIYARKSTESEDRQVLSIDSQVKELKSFAEHEGLKVGRVFIESKSAKSPGRPVFNELFSLVQKGKIDAVMSWKLDRIARNPVDGGAVIWAMEERQLQAIYTPQRVFLNTGNDKFWMQLEFGMAKKYVDDLSDNVKRGLRAKIESGWKPGAAPIGYLNDKNLRTIEKDPERFPLVRRIWDLMLTGSVSPASILTRTDIEWGLRTRPSKRRGGRPLSLSEMYRLLHEPFYYGMFVNRGELHRGSHEPMITSAEFNRVQAILRSHVRVRPKSKSFPYTGLIKCGECGCSVTAEHKVNRQGHHYTYYHCTRRRQSAHCRQQMIEERALEGQIAEFLESITLPRQIIDWALRIIGEFDSEEAEKEKAAFHSLKLRHSACIRELDELIDIRLRGLLSDDEFKRKKNKLENERIRLTESLEGPANRKASSSARCRQFFEFTGSARSKFVDASPDDKKVILSSIGSNLVLCDRKLSIQAHKPFTFVRTLKSDHGTRGVMFEPAEIGSAQPRSEHAQQDIPDIQGLVKDVRTFFRDHPSECFPFLKLHESSVRD